DAVEPELIGEARPPRDFAPRHALLGDVQTESHVAPLTRITVPFVHGVRRRRTPRRARRRTLCGRQCVHFPAAAYGTTTRCSPPPRRRHGPTSTRPAPCTDTATSGRWVRGDPCERRSSAGTSAAGARSRTTPGRAAIRRARRRSSPRVPVAKWEGC